MVSEWIEVRCFGCKEWSRMKADRLVPEGPRGFNRHLCLACVERKAVRESVKRVSNHIGLSEQDASQGRLFDE